VAKRELPFFKYVARLTLKGIVMELIIITGTHTAQHNSLLIQRLVSIGYVHLDPDMYCDQDLTLAALDFNELLEAKRWCLQESLSSVAAGVPVVLSGDFIAPSDLQVFREIQCDIEFIDAETAPHSLISKLSKLRNRNQANHVSEHWLGFKLFQAKRA
jgi:hypothetical protein